MQTLTVTEYTSISIGNRCDPERRIITEAQALRLERLAESLQIPAFEWKRRHVVPRQFVGILPLGDLRIEVLPKIDRHGDAPGTANDAVRQRTRLLELLHLTRRLPIHTAGLAGLHTRKADLLEIYIHIFAEGLLRELRKGVLRRYQALDENLRVLRGKLLFHEQLRVNTVHAERMYCRHESFLEDNLHNQVLKAAAMLLLHETRNVDSRRLLKNALLVLDPVSSVPPRSLNLQTMTIDRTIRRYEYLLEIAKVVLAGRSHEVAAGRATQIAVVFDMNALFEEAIAIALKRGFRHRSDFRVITQGPIRHLLREENKKRFRLKPDVTILENGKPRLIVDTKWKLLDGSRTNLGLSQSDLYQMYAYAHRYDCPDVVLLYPWHERLTETMKQYTIERTQREPAQPARLWVTTVDLSEPRRLSELIQSAFLPMIEAPDSEYMPLAERHRSSS